MRMQRFGVGKVRSVAGPGGPAGRSWRRESGGRTTITAMSGGDPYALDYLPEM